jgi:uncharacterized protein (DUF983 family)
MMRIIRALFDGLILRCPRCHQGRMFQRGFTMNRSCPHCGLQFEQASGEVTGGMGINFVLTLFIVIAGSLFGLDPTIPIAPLLGGLVLFAIVFPILFYRSSRGLWAAVLYLTGDNTEGDSARRM